MCIRDSYYEWQRQNGGGRAPRNVGDFECGRDIGDRNVHRRLSFAFNLIQTAYKQKHDPSVEITDPEIAEKEKALKDARDNATYIKDSLLRIIRNTIHLNEVVAPRFRQTNEDVNQDARIQFITKIYDDKKFASLAFMSATIPIVLGNNAFSLSTATLAFIFFQSLLTHVLGNVLTTNLRVHSLLQSLFIQVDVSWSRI